MNKATRMSTADRILELAVRNKVELQRHPRLQGGGDRPSAGAHRRGRPPSPRPTTCSSRRPRPSRSGTALDPARGGHAPRRRRDRRGGRRRQVPAALRAARDDDDLAEDPAGDARQRRRAAAPRARLEPPRRGGGHQEPAASRRTRSCASARAATCREDVLRIIALDREWTRSHQIKLNLVVEPADAVRVRVEAHHAPARARAQGARQEQERVRRRGDGGAAAAAATQRRQGDAPPRGASVDAARVGPGQGTAMKRTGPRGGLVARARAGAAFPSPPACSRPARSALAIAVDATNVYWLNEGPFEGPGGKGGGYYPNGSLIKYARSRGATTTRPSSPRAGRSREAWRSRRSRSRSTRACCTGRATERSSPAPSAAADARRPSSGAGWAAPRGSRPRAGTSSGRCTTSARSSPAWLQQRALRRRERTGRPIGHHLRHERPLLDELQRNARHVRNSERPREPLPHLARDRDGSADERARRRRGEHLLHERQPGDVRERPPVQQGVVRRDSHRAGRRAERPAGIAVDGSTVYWTEGGGLYKCAVGGCNDAPTFVAESASQSFAIDGANLYLVQDGMERDAHREDSEVNDFKARTSSRRWRSATRGIGGRHWRLTVRVSMSTLWYGFHVENE